MKFPDRQTAGENTLLYFVRFPEPGKVKTRLGADIGMERAAEIYRDMVESGLALLESLEHQGVRIVTVFTPASRRKEMREWLGPSRLLEAQSEGNLGDRLSSAFQMAFDSGGRRIIALGSDTLGFTADLLRSAFLKLERADAVLGPAVDGGYYLIGLSQFRREVFGNIPWSTSRVAEETLSRFRSFRISYEILAELSDLDDIAAMREWERNR